LRGGGQDSAVGSLSTLVGTFPGLTTTFDARRRPPGENPTGSARVTTRVTFAEGPVTCLAGGHGNGATIGSRETDFPFDGAEGRMLFVENNDTQGVGRDSIKFTLLAAPPTDCPVNTVVSDPRVTVISSYLTVADASRRPRPRTKARRAAGRSSAPTTRGSASRSCSEGQSHNGRYEDENALR
jgi:hypothetical protein